MGKGFEDDGRDGRRAHLKTPLLSGPRVEVPALVAVLEIYLKGTFNPLLTRF